MFKLFTSTTTDPGLEEAISALLEEMNQQSPLSDEYSKLVDLLDRLYKIKGLNETSGRVTPDALINVFGNLAGIVAILGFERAHVITTKALGFVMKPRL